MRDSKSIERKRFIKNILAKWNRLTIFSTLLCIFVTLYIITQLINNQEAVITIEVVSRLSKAQSHLSELKRYNRRLLKTLKDIENIDVTIDKADRLLNLQEELYRLHVFNTSEEKIERSNEPSMEYQKLQRRIMNNIKEFWYFIGDRVEKMKTQVSKSVIPKLDHILSLGQEHTRFLLSNMVELVQEDGYNEWRKEEADDLSALVWQRLYTLQNPTNCKEAKKLICRMDSNCDYGCQIHDLLSCFMIGYNTQRTVILEFKGWDDVFQILSETCTTNDDAGDTWPGEKDSRVISITSRSAMSSKSKYVHHVVPEDLAPRLLRLHGNAALWWTGHILKYILNYQKKTKDYIASIIERLHLRYPIVGVYIGSTNASSSKTQTHHVEKYMKEVDEYYNQLQLTHNITKRTVYLATDNSNIVTELKKKYPDYQILFNTKETETSNMNLTYPSRELLHYIVDVHILSLTNFLVCKFSLDICRLAYELMQTYHPDASASYKSLDNVYFYSQQLYKGKVILAHKGVHGDEINLEPNDIIDIVDNHWNGYSMGTNLRTNKSGLFPSFKVDMETEFL